MTPAVILISLLSLLFGNDEAEIVFAGDAMMHQGQLDAARRSHDSYDFKGYFTNIREYIAGADYAVVNLETPMSRPPYSGYPCFNSPASYAEELADAGFNLFLTANNHALDRRDKGVCNTVATLDSLKLSHIGTYKNQNGRDASLPFIRTINNIDVAFLNYTYGTNGIIPGKDIRIDYIDRDLIKNDVAKARMRGAEVVIVCIHWGNEYQLVHNTAQKSLAEYIHSLGVEIIIGSHPHVIQPMELTYGTSPTLTVYSLGNFISNMKTVDTRGGCMVKIKLKRGNDLKVRLSEASYRLFFTEPANAHSNYSLWWVDQSKNPHAKAFAKSARSIFAKYNRNVSENKPGLTEYLQNSAK